jgi:putative transposase
MLQSALFLLLKVDNFDSSVHLKPETMHFEAHNIYHIYNQGNNRQSIFFRHENYLFFIKKMRTHILPFGDFLCYCLMPNHFHWLIYVREPKICIHNELDQEGQPIIKLLTLNHSIGILLRSYTRAINKQESRSGALFRQQTKAKDGWEDPYTYLYQNQAQVCQNHDAYRLTTFQYIHQNPVKAKLVERPEDWPYSSAQDYAALRNGKLCNQDLAKELLFLR